MSEYVPAVAQRYTELMAPAFVEAICTTPDIPEGMEPDALLLLYSMQPAIRQRLHEVDWASSGLPIKQYEGPDDSLKQRDQLPGEYADCLMAFAFDDIWVIFQLCNAFAVKHGLQKKNLQEALLNSKKTILSVALLADPDKNEVYRLFKHPELEGLNFDGVALPPAEDAIILSTDQNGRKRFDWHPDIQNYIRDNVWEGRGCPAHRHIVTAQDGQKQSLLYYFWDRAVETAYPVN